MSIKNFISALYLIIIIIGSLLFISFLSLAICHILYSDSYFPIDFGKWFWINIVISIFLRIFWLSIESFEIHRGL